MKNNLVIRDYLSNWKEDTDVTSYTTYRETWSLVVEHAQPVDMDSWRRIANYNMKYIQEPRHATSYTSSTCTHFMQPVTDKQK